jgi:hypothetical protein
MMDHTNVIGNIINTYQNMNMMYKDPIIHCGITMTTYVMKCKSSNNSMNNPIITDYGTMMTNRYFHMQLFSIHLLRMHLVSVGARRLLRYDDDMMIMFLTIMIVVVNPTDRVMISMLWKFHPKKHTFSIHASYEELYHRDYSCY